MEGLFRVQHPSVLLAYDQENDIRSSISAKSATRTLPQNTYVSLKIFLDPVVPKLTLNMVSIL